MGKLTEQALSQVPLDALGVVAVRGADARRFLQGQLSQNVDVLRPSDLLLAGYHSPKGRVLAVVRLYAQAHDDVLMVMPRELAEALAARLSKFVLRAKARISDESALWQLLGHDQPAADRHAWADRFVSIERRGDREPLVGEEALQAAQRWRASDIAAGLPQVYAPTSEMFVAQMLNLDVLNGIAFDKGCYTGQEIIARAHYRGRVKRRMQRYLAHDSQPLAPGEKLVLSDGRDALVVDAVTLPDGTQEFLAVAAYGPSDDEAISSAATTPNSRRVVASSLPLPYSLPL